MEYKIKASLLAFGLFVALTGSLVTVDDWQDFTQEERIELIMTAEELTDEQKTLLLTVMQLENNEFELQELVERQAQVARVEVGQASSPYQKEQWRQAAKYFDRSAKTIFSLRSKKNNYRSKFEELEKAGYTTEIRASMERVVAKLLADIERESQQLHDELVQAFFAVGLLNKYETLDQKDQQAQNASPLNILGIISMVIGLIISVITAAKLIIDYRKAQIELALLKNKLNERA